MRANRLVAEQARGLIRRAWLHTRAPDEMRLAGVRLRLDEDWVTPTVRASIYDGVYEEAEAEIIRATLGPEDRVLEIGCGPGFIATIASGVVGDRVRGYDANPAMVSAARRTSERNGAAATFFNAVLQHEPESEHIAFYVHEEFWTSSLAPDDRAEKIDVPVLDLAGEIDAQAATYLIVDIEGAETDLLRPRLPESVRKLCVECHPAVTTAIEISAMLAALLAQGFALDLGRTRLPVLYLAR